MGATMLQSDIPDLYKVLLANLDQVTWMKYEIPLEMMDLFNRRTGKGSFINDTGVSGLGVAPVKPEGVSSAVDQFYQGFDKKYTPQTYSLMYLISKEAVDRGQHLKIARSAMAFERSFRATKETLLAAPINDGFSTNLAADGVPLFSASHLSEGPGVGNRKNTLATAADLSVTSFQLAMNDYRDTRDGRGLLVNVDPGKLVVPTENEWLAWEVLKSQGRPDTANRADNAFLMSPTTKGMGVSVKRYITDADSWGIWPVNNSDHDLNYLEWEAFQTYAAIDFNTDDFKYKAREGYVIGAGMFEGLYYVPGA